MTVLNDILDIANVIIKPQRNDEVEGIGSGQILRAELTTPLWSVVITTPLMEFDAGRQIRALLNDLNRPGQYFDVYDPIGAYPRLDPNGTLLGSSTITVTAIDSTSGMVTLGGFPAGYKISVGDYLEIDYAGRRVFYEASQAVTATGVGAAGPFRVFPNISQSIPLASVVTLKKPMIRCQFIPDGITYGMVDSQNWKMAGFTLNAVQKL